MKHRKAMRKAILVAGSSMLIALYSNGCQSYQPQQIQAMDDFFPGPGEVRDFHRIERVQAASGARGCDASAVSLRQG